MSVALSYCRGGSSSNLAGGLLLLRTLKGDLPTHSKTLFYGTAYVSGILRNAKVTGSVTSHAAWCHVHLRRSRGVKML